VIPSAFDAYMHRYYLSDTICHMKVSFHYVVFPYFKELLLNHLCISAVMMMQRTYMHFRFSNLSKEFGEEGER